MSPQGVKPRLRVASIGALISQVLNYTGFRIRFIFRTNSNIKSFLVTGDPTQEEEANTID
jgi:hypothetical protein